LEKTIQSVISQGYPNLEYIIIDGGSSDNSLEIIKKYQKYLSFWVSEPDRGQAHAINKGLAHATGELLGWLNSDDYFLPGALQHLVDAYLQDNTIGAVYGQGHIVNEDNEIIYTPKLQQVTLESLYEWSYGNDFMQPSCLFTRAAWEECGPLDESIHIAMDVDLWLNIVKKYRFRRIQNVLSHSLSHENAKTSAFRNLMNVDLALVVYRHGGHQAARRMLEEQAERLSKQEAFYESFGKNPFLRAVRRYVNRSQMNRHKPRWKTENL
jgi:glycosyltransferase involved in cell wall biosynthesis